MAALGISIVGFTPTRHHTDTFRGRTAEQWYARAVVRREQRDDLQQRLTKRVRQIRRLERQLATRPYGSQYAIRLAASTFHVPEAEMRAVASCETGGTYDRYAQNRSSTASGLFQFLDSTWASQGLAGFSVFDPVANALAAARIVAREGWSQWSCKP
jgi:hypothetical protein